MLYFRTLIAMILVNLFFYFTLKEITYLWYVAFVMSYAMLVAALNGVAYQYSLALFPLCRITCRHDGAFVFDLDCCSPALSGHLADCPRWDLG